MSRGQSEPGEQAHKVQVVHLGPVNCDIIRGEDAPSASWVGGPGIPNPAANGCMQAIATCHKHTLSRLFAGLLLGMSAAGIEKLKAALASHQDAFNVTNYQSTDVESATWIYKPACPWPAAKDSMHAGEALYLDHSLSCSWPSHS